MKNIKYIGTKESKTDNVAGTGLTWSPGQSHAVPPVAAAKLLGHPGVWSLADDEVVSKEDFAKAKQEADDDAAKKMDVSQTLEEQAVNPSAVPDLNRLDSATLDKIAIERYGHTFRKNATDQSKREKITQLELSGKALA
jgi:hypothetical protein